MSVLDFGFNIISPFLQPVVVGFLTCLSMLKFYSYVTCGYFKEKVQMNGKTIIVTGATGGIGKETALELAKRGARVILACRNVVSGEKVKAEIIEATKNDNIVVSKLDLSLQKSVREFAESINKTEERLDVLIHNAGTAENKFIKTEDGIEVNVATNHFGPFLLTHLLIDLLKRTQSSRIVVVASELYRITSLNLNNLNPSSSLFPAWIYYPSKYANICFTLELARRLEGTGVTANCLHPGMIDSGIWRNVPIPLSWALQVIVKFFCKTPNQGCQTTLFLACSEEVKNVSGKYFMDCAERQLCNGTLNASKAKKLWELSEQIVNLKNTDPKI